MGEPDLEAAVRSLAAYPEYQQAFQNAFGRPPNGKDLIAAIASYERALTSFDSPFDRFLAGDDDATGEKARSEEHTSELQSPDHLLSRLLLEKKKAHTLPT